VSAVRNSKIKFDSGALSCILAKLIMQSLANGKVFYYADALEFTDND
jgi:hypothetical protein